MSIFNINIPDIITFLYKFSYSLCFILGGLNAKLVNIRVSGLNMLDWMVYIFGVTAIEYALIIILPEKIAQLFV